jgi:hypothetical protein
MVRSWTATPVEDDRPQLDLSDEEDDANERQRRAKHRCELRQLKSVRGPPRKEEKRREEKRRETNQAGEAEAAARGSET